MKIVVITRHAISNYGSLLQAIATQQIIEQLGHTCEIIDYVREDESYLKYEKTILTSKSNWNNNVIKKALYLLLRQPESIIAGKKFEKEQRSYLKLTRRYATYDELLENKPVADIYMTGSDQVWGPVANSLYDAVYCLSFTNETEKKISYAASFGHTDMTAELGGYYRRWLNRYDHISVREESAKEILKKMGIEALQVIDPTLLLTSSDWDTYIKPIKQKNYVLVYQIHNDRCVGEYAKKVAKVKGLKIIRISASLHQLTREGNFVWLPKIGEFLSYIKNAEYMITDSFHGTAFAINFNIPFVEILPNNNTGIRNISILNRVRLSERILKCKDDIALVNKKIDFAEVNRILAKERDESIRILKSMIEN